MFQEVLVLNQLFSTARLSMEQLRINLPHYGSTGYHLLFIEVETIALLSQLLVLDLLLKV